jgi:hypothetical protein
LKLKCLHNRSSSLPDSQRGRFREIDEEYYLTIGESYSVVGMHLFENVLSVLVRDDNRLPSFVPAGLFELGAHGLPDGWKFALADGLLAAEGPDLWSHPLVSVWGYDELVLDPRHNDDLLESVPEALAIFHREVDAQSAVD